MRMRVSKPEFWTDTIIAAAIMLVSGLYVLPHLHIGWVPSDEGTLAQSALRVYQGQLPHRDFAEIYTGGLSMIHAAAFHAFGVNLFSLRICAFLFFLTWLPAVYWIARRFVSPLWAAAVTLTAVTWGYPNYVAAMPSWYNLFFATFGAAALFRFLETRSRRWLILAGAFGGASILIKVIGLYYVAAVLLFLLFVEQSRLDAALPPKSSRLYRIVCGSCLVLYLALLTWMIWPQMHTGEVYHFLVPSALCVALLLWRERVASNLSSRERFAGLLGLVWPFLLGIAAMILIYLIPYAASGSIPLLLQGIVGSANARMTGLAGQMRAPNLVLSCYGLITFEIIVIAMYWDWMRARKSTWVIAALLMAGLGWCVFPVEDNLWLMAGTLTPLAVLLGVGVLMSGSTWGAADVKTQQKTMLLVSLAAICSLVQFPFPYITYFCYTATLTLLAIVATVCARKNRQGRVVLALLLLAFIGIGMHEMVRRHIFNPDMQIDKLHTLELPRGGGLRIDATTPDYETLIPFLQAHSSNGLLYAGNDCPELYFLSGLKNPTRDDTGAPVEQVLAALRSGKLQLVAINDQSFFATGTTSPQFRAEIASYLSHTTKIGRFSIYWL